VQYGKKRKNIVKNINTKLQQWVDSIFDEKLREAIRKDAIVTGGSIASMYLGEPVNDYDIYFRTKETTKLVADYYVNYFTTENPGRLQIVEDKDDRIKIFIQSAGVLLAPHESLSESFDDDEKQIEELGDEPSHDKMLYKPIFLSQNAITLSNKIQIIVRFYGTPEEIHKNFDFIHAQCYFDYKSQELVAPAEALESMLSRTLVYKGSLYPICSIFRAKKFANRGWNIGAGELLKMAFQISELDLTSIEVLNDQLIGVDSLYMIKLIEALSSVATTHPEKINSQYVIALIDKIFG
jgi:hypothetical protein